LAVNGNGVGLWKWLAGILCAILLAGVPGLVYAIQAPSKDDWQEINDEQQKLNVQVQVLQAQLMTLQMQYEKATEQLERLNDELAAHAKEG
jgi:peptidoglycan hydrolase CwlO-like protein